MTVHMFRVFVGTSNPGTNGLESRINAWLGVFARWDGDPVQHELFEAQTEGGTVYYRIDVRFLPTNGKSDIQADLATRLQGSVDWYRLGYHECTHRAGDGSAGPCSWDDSAEWTAQGVTIPADVPQVV